MSRLFLLSSLTAAALLGGGMTGLALAEGQSAPGPQPAVERPRSAAPSVAAMPQADLVLPVAGQEALTGLLSRSGIASLDSALADSRLSAVRLAEDGFLHLWLGQPVGADKRLLVRLEARTAEGRRLVLERHGDDFFLSERPGTIDSTSVRVRASAGGGLRHSLAAAGIPDRLVTKVERLEGSAEAAAVDLIVAHEDLEGESRFGPLLYAALIDRNGRSRRWMVGSGGALEPVAPNVAVAGLQRPVAGPVSSRPGYRVHPILRYLRWHRGTDFAAPAGSPVRAAMEGRVVEAGWRGGYGKVVRLAHADGTHTAYAHLSRIAVAPGEHVGQGAELGAVGDTGLATGPHLHFEWLRNGQTLEPRFGAGGPQYDVHGPRFAELRALLAAPFREPS